MLRLETSARGQTTDIRQEALARGRQHHVQIISVDRKSGPVPLESHDATVDHFVLNGGPQDHVLLGPLSRGRAESASVLVDRALEAQDVAEQVVW